MIKREERKVSKRKFRLKISCVQNLKQKLIFGLKKLEFYYIFENNIFVPILQYYLTSNASMTLV
jgi:hypothetical protein